MRQILLVPVVALMLLAAGCAPSKPKATYGEILLHGDKNGEPVGNVEKFFTHEKAIRMSCTVAPDANKVRSTWKLVGLDTTEGKNIEILSLTEVISGPGFSAMFQVPKLWPVGKYRIELFIDGTTVAQRDFQIVSDGAPAHEVGVAAFRMRRELNGKPGAMVKNFRPSDRHMFFEAETIGSYDKEATVKWMFAKREDSQDIKVYDVSMKVKLVAGTVLTADLKLPRDWPTGKYVAQIFLDGAAWEEFEFEVVAQ